MLAERKIQIGSFCLHFLSKSVGSPTGMLICQTRGILFILIKVIFVCVHVFLFCFVLFNFFSPTFFSLPFFPFPGLLSNPDNVFKSGLFVFPCWHTSEPSWWTKWVSELKPFRNDIQELVLICTDGELYFCFFNGWGNWSRTNFGNLLQPSDAKWFLAFYHLWHMNTCIIFVLLWSLPGAVHQIAGIRDKWASSAGIPAQLPFHLCDLFCDTY